MKVFEFNPSTGKRGAFLEEMNRPDAIGNPAGVRCKLPVMPDAQWIVATELSDRNNKPMAFDRPVCFCLGQWTAGTDTHWQWVAYLPQ